MENWNESWARTTSDIECRLHITIRSTLLFAAVLCRDYLDDFNATILPSSEGKIYYNVLQESNSRWHIKKELGNTSVTVIKRYNCIWKICSRIASSSLCNLQKSFCLDPKHTQNNRCLSIRKQAVGLDPYYLHSNNGSRIMGITWEITLARVSFYNCCCPIHTAGDYGMDIRRQNYVSAPASNHVQVIRPYVVPNFCFLHVFVTRTYISRCTNPGSQTGFCHFVTRYQR